MGMAVPVLEKLNMDGLPFMRAWEKIHEYDDDEKRRKHINLIYKDFLEYLDSPVSKIVGDKFREPQYKYIMKIINSIAQVTEAIDRGGPKVE